MKIKKKNLNHAHIYKNGEIILFYKKLDKESGKYVEWEEKQTEKLSISIAGKNAAEFNFSHLTFHSEIVRIIDKIKRIQIYTNNESENTKTLNMLVNTVILNISDDITLYFNETTFQNRQINIPSVSICY